MIETESKKAETYTDASVYEELYRRTEWVAGHSDMADDTRRQHLHETLVLACREALKESRQGFGSLFAQVDYLCRKHNISAYDTMEIQRMRRNGKAELRQHEQRTSNVKRKGESGKGEAKEAIHLADISILWNYYFMHRRKYSQLFVEQK